MRVEELKFIFVLTLSFDEGVEKIWSFSARNEENVWKYIFENPEQFPEILDGEIIPKRGVESKEKLQEYCNDTFVDGDSFPAIEMNKVKLINIFGMISPLV
jgi:hypothetical protein